MLMLRPTTYSIWVVREIHRNNNIKKTYIAIFYIKVEFFFTPFRSSLPVVKQTPVPLQAQLQRSFS
jgi:hypothetical protein